MLTEPRRTLPWFAALAWMGLIYFLSAQGDVPGSGLLPDWPGLDKAVHFLLFGTLGALLRGAGLGLAPAVAVAAAYGAVDEVHQAFVPGRSPDPVDWLADLLGAWAGARAVGYLTAATRRWRGPIE